MNGYRIDNKYEYISRTVTDGTQRKYKKGEFFYKINKNGNEGYVEYLVYRLLCKSTIPKDMLVRYEYCRINDRLGPKAKKQKRLAETMSFVYNHYNVLNFRRK